MSLSVVEGFWAREEVLMPRSFERVLPHCERLDPEIRQ